MINPASLHTLQTRPGGYRNQSGVSHCKFQIKPQQSWNETNQNNREERGRGGRGNGKLTFPQQCLSHTEKDKMTERKWIHLCPVSIFPVWLSSTKEKSLRRKSRWWHLGEQEKKNPHEPKHIQELVCRFLCSSVSKFLRVREVQLQLQQPSRCPVVGGSEVSVRVMAGQAAEGRAQAALLLLLWLLQVALMGTFAACCLSAWAGQRRREGEDLLTKRRSSLMCLPTLCEETEERRGGAGRKVALEQHTDGHHQTTAGATGVS